MERNVKEFLLPQKANPRVKPKRNNLIPYLTTMSIIFFMLHLLNVNLAVNVLNN